MQIFEFLEEESPGCVVQVDFLCKDEGSKRKGPE
jgi:hypothetical protein